MDEFTSNPPGSIVRKENNDTAISKSSRRKSNHGTSSDLRPWAGLPDDLLGMISKRLSFVDYLAFGGVCKSWRLFAVACRERFMASVPPHIVLISTHAKRTISLYNISDGKEYKTMLPNLVGMSCLGFSCGYLIMLDRGSELWLVNLITREELHFPKLPSCHKLFLLFDFRIIMAYSTALSEFVIVYAQRCHKHLHFCRARDMGWTVCSFDEQPWVIVDLTVFNSKIYVLTDHGKLGIFEMRPHPRLMLLDVRGTQMYRSLGFQLLTSNDELLMADTYGLDRIWKLDQTKMEWVVVESMGENAFFLNVIQSSMANTSMWGGVANCTYDFEVQDGPPLRPCFWYFPHLSHNKNLLQDGV